MKRGKILVAYLVIMLCMQCTIANAMTQTLYTSTEQPPLYGFTNAWSASAVFTVPLGAGETPLYATGTYGYDTWMTNEDFIKNVATSVTAYKVRGRVISGSGEAAYTNYAPEGGSTGKADVTHSGNVAYYYAQYKYQY